jgi:hypothetical protein
MKIGFRIGRVKFSFGMKVGNAPFKEPFTRYFSFSRVNPSDRDYGVLFETCTDIDAYLVYRTKHVNGVDRLDGYMVLNGPRAYARDICRLFPNFMVTHLKPDVYSMFMDGGEVNVRGQCPFESIRRKLFIDTVGRDPSGAVAGLRKRLFDEVEDDVAVAVVAYPVVAYTVPNEGVQEEG